MNEIVTTAGNRGLHVWIIWPITTLWHCPIYVLAGILDVTSLAMHAVLEIDDKPRIAALFLDHLIDPRRAIALRRFGIFWQVHTDRHACVFERQMRRLAFFVVGEGKTHIRCLLYTSDAADD